MALQSFRCEPGNHSVNVEAEPGDPIVLPAGWAYARASHIPGMRVEADAPYDAGIWYADESSDRTVLVCPHHELVKVDA